MPNPPRQKKAKSDECGCQKYGHEFHARNLCNRGWGINEEIPCTCRGIETPRPSEAFDKPTLAKRYADYVKKELKKDVLFRELCEALAFCLEYGDFEESCTDNKLASGCLDKAQALLRRTKASIEKGA